MSAGLAGEAYGSPGPAVTNLFAYSTLEMLAVNAVRGDASGAVAVGGEMPRTPWGAEATCKESSEQSRTGQPSMIWDAELQCEDAC